MQNTTNPFVPIKCLVFLVSFFWVYPSLGLAEIRFKDVSAEANITHAGTSYGASWGDFNADGWPDLWVGNHNTKPTLYLNKQDGTFENIIDRIWKGNPKADTHAAAWADFDNDGDQDLIELLDAFENEDGTFCLGCGKNHFFINEGGKLSDRAADFDIDKGGEARSPVWWDFDRDGLLDLLVVNTRARDNPGSKLYLQKSERFVEANETLHFKDGKFEGSEKTRWRIEKLISFTYPSLPSFNTQRHLEFAQLADLSSNGYPDLILFSRPTRIFAIDSIPFKEITNKINLPHLHKISDVAIADFNGDQRMDMYVARGTYMPSDLIRTGSSGIKGMLTCCGRSTPKAVLFQTEGDVHFQIYPTWQLLSKIYIGLNGLHPESRSFTLSPLNPDLHGLVDPSGDNFDGVSISFDPDSRTWAVYNFSQSIFLDLIANATQPIKAVKTIGFEPFKAQGLDALLMSRKDGFIEKPLVGEAGTHTTGYSVLAGDFDNDMDVDLYLTCTGPVENLPNHLLENDGKGNFTVVQNAGGAAGSKLGRGDVVASADYDRNGTLDLFITNGHDPTSPFTSDGPHQLFQNQGSGNHWLEIDLIGTKSNRDGIGARVEITANGVVQIREQSGGMHRITQNHQRLHFGLGKHEKADRITVKWPSGIVQHLNNVKANQILSINESSTSEK